MRIPKQYRDFVKAARAAGWREEQRKDSIVFYPTDGSRPIPVHNSPGSKGPTIANARAQFRRAGLDV